MAEDLASTIQIDVKGKLTKAFDIIGNNSITPALAKTLSLTWGTSDGQANRIYHDRHTLGADEDKDYVLEDDSLVDVFGDALSFTAIKCVAIHNRETTYTDRELYVGGGDGGDGTNAWDSWINSNTPGNAGSEYVIVGPNGLELRANPGAGWSVSAGVDTLRVLNSDSANSVTYDIILIGVDNS